jgi:hypothetical protein
LSFSSLVPFVYSIIYTLAELNSIVHYPPYILQENKAKRQKAATPIPYPIGKRMEADLQAKR